MKTVGFMQPVYIRKHSPEMLQKLRDLGYKVSFLVCKYDGYATSYESVVGITNDMYDSPNPHISWAIQGKRIDCGTNEDLFFALAALHTNQDKGCWFTDDTTWIQCTDLFWKGDKSFHRASVKEIQGYFK